MSRREQRKKEAARRRSKLAGRDAAAPGVDLGPLPDLPPRTHMERAMRDMFGDGDEDSADQAQELAYEAMDAAHAGQVHQAIELARRAVKLDPNCVDALLLLAQATSRSGKELLNRLRETVMRGEAALGAEFFEENTGHFWGLLETRPYMRARALLAEGLAETGRVEEAVGHYEEMLRLNPADNQGLRYALLGHYLALGRVDGARRLLEEYDDDASAVFKWGHVLERFVSGDMPAAEQALAEARRSNRHVEAYLTQSKPMPRELPGYHGFGDENEAMICADAIGAAWHRQPAARAWLRQQRPS